ncbi:MAG: DUF3419 family protein [Gammaproteobacteria bacterium]
MQIERAAPEAPLRYASCWEDADVLLAALDPRPGEACLSIASAGDNTLSLLSRCTARVIAVDCSAAQLACLRLRAAACRRLDHDTFLELLGARPSTRRIALYDRLRPHLDADTLTTWDARRHAIAAGIGGAGRFERYLSLFRRRVLPLVHGREHVHALFHSRAPQERRRFYREVWNNRRWRWLVRAYCSRFVTARIGREPEFFRYAEGDIGAMLLARLERVLCELDPAANPYLHWMAFGTFGDALPHALRAGNFGAIRAGLDRLEVRLDTLESCLEALPENSIGAFNLSDVFEYMSPEQARGVYERIARVARAGARIAYWNTHVPRERPPHLAARIRPRDDIAAPLACADRMFFYRAFRVEEVVAP